MKKQKLYCLFGSFSLVCVLAIAFLAFSNWKLQAELQNIKRAPAAAPTAMLDALPSPWGKDLDPWLHNWDSSGYFSGLQARMDEMMKAMSPGVSFFNKQGFGYSSASPIVEMQETPEQYEVLVRVPEEQEVDLTAEFKDGQLVITGKVKTEVTDIREDRSSRVFRASRFSQSIYLPEPVDELALRVESQENQFSITVPKT